MEVYDTKNRYPSRRTWGRIKKTSTIIAVSIYSLRLKRFFTFLNRADTIPGHPTHGVRVLIYTTPRPSGRIRFFVSAVSISNSTQNSSSNGEFG